jgi:hypothetical protein
MHALSTKLIHYIFPSPQKKNCRKPPSCRPFLRPDQVRTGAVRLRHLPTHQLELQVPLQDGLQRADLRTEAQTLRRKPLRESRSVHRERRRLPVPLSRVVGGREVREEDVAHTVQAPEREDVPRALLARLDDRLRRDGRHRAGLVREATLPREDREAAGRREREEQEYEYARFAFYDAQTAAQNDSQ